MADRPLVLLSNDDGYSAAGIEVLHEVLARSMDVVRVAPETEQSAHSHALTLSRPLRHRKVSEGVHAVDGTPADCVYVALFQTDLLPRRPDVVVSGMNHGMNLGTDIFYSGTVAAAREGALRGIPSIALSMDHGGNRERGSEFAAELVHRLALEADRGTNTPLLNVNFPTGDYLGVRVARLGLRSYNDAVVVRKDPRGREYYWIGGPVDTVHLHMDGSDTEAVDLGMVAITPLLIEATHEAHFDLARRVIGDKLSG
ncbi:MAG: 5'/3'-nucleotidase SurE [Sandaracinaceae bacterium]|nr:5'/3'-nucleotidase SurE [Sandaracinaceae bacterium]